MPAARPQQTARPLRVPDLHAGVRHVPARLQADVRVKAFMPPQGLLLIAAYMPESWPVRFVDENITPATDADLAWADIVMVTGMHIQAEQIHDIARRAHAAGKPV